MWTIPHEAGLRAYAEDRLAKVPAVRLLGTAREKASIVSFVMDNAHPHDIGTIVDRAGVAVRTGHHCAQPLMDRLNVTATARASIGLYNTRGDIDTLAAALESVSDIFG